MFYNCASLKSLPDISKWNTANVNNMNSMFNGCLSLTALPDISEWDISKVTSKSKMFDNCSGNFYIPSDFKK